MSLIATLVQLGSFGLPSSNTYFIAQDQARFRAAAFNSLMFALGVGLVLALAVQRRSFLATRNGLVLLPPT